MHVPMKNKKNSFVTFPILRNLAQASKNLTQTSHVYNVQSHAAYCTTGALKQLCDNPNAKILTVLTKRRKLCII